VAERLAAAGIDDEPGAGAAADCGPGITAAALVLAAEHIRLRPPEHPLALYVGSWSNWSADPARPAATAAAP